MTAACPDRADPLTPDALRRLAVLMAVSQGPASPADIAAKLARLAAPGFACAAADADAAVARLQDEGRLEATASGELAITPEGRALAETLGGRTPGSACDSARVCLLLRLCLDGVMPAANRCLLVRALLAGGDLGAAEAG
jgi:hypothetical protein